MWLNVRPVSGRGWVLPVNPWLYARVVSCRTGVADDCGPMVADGTLGGYSTPRVGAIPPRGILVGVPKPGARKGNGAPHGRRDPRAHEPVRVHPPQGRLPEAVAPHRGSGPR